MQADLLGKTLNILIGYTRQKIIKNLEKRLKKKKTKKKISLANSINYFTSLPNSQSVCNRTM